MSLRVPSQPQPRLALLALLALLAAPAAADDVYTMEFVDLGAYPLAVCLDGTPAAYYISAGAATTKFVSHFQGGAWCGSLGDCAGRAKSALGSSAAAYWPRNVTCPPGSSGAPWVCNFDGGNGGLFSSNATVNPQMHDASTTNEPARRPPPTAH